MLKLSGVFDLFENIDKIPVFEIQKFLSSGIQENQLENYVGNRVLYPQTIPLNKKDFEIDCAIISACLKKEPQRFYSVQLKRVTLPGDFILRFPEGAASKILANGLSVSDIVQIVTKVPGGQKNLGTIISRDKIFLPYTDKETIQTFKLDGKVVSLSDGKLNVIPLLKNQAQAQIGQEKEFTVFGGEIGLIIDLREKS